MIREAYNPEFRLNDSVVTKDGPNLDSEIVKAFAKTRDALEVLLINAFGKRGVKADGRSISPLLSAGLISMDIFNDFQTLGYWAGIAKQRKLKGGETRSRYMPSSEPDDRMPGSTVPLSKGDVGALLKTAIVIEKAIGRATRRLSKPKTKEALKRALRVH